MCVLRVRPHAAELKASVGFEDARRAVSEAKQHTKAKAAAALQASNKTWSDRLAAARAEVQLLQGQLRELQQQRDQLAAQVRLSWAALTVCNLAC
jgi:predicted  nucleic acid-binding Zn-ribbon protein